MNNSHKILVLKNNHFNKINIINKIICIKLLKLKININKLQNLYPHKIFNLNNINKLI
jgi:hypothetical protein